MFTICLQFGHTLFTTDLYNVLKDKGKGYTIEVPKVYNMKHYIELNNRTFEVKKLKGKVQPLEYRSLYDCYNKPSSLKKDIYSDWYKWLVELTFDESSDYGYGILTVLSYNCMIFTLGAEVYNKKCELIGYLYISKTRQELWTV